MVYENRLPRGRPSLPGGASGIGLSVAGRLAREGAAVALWDLKEDALARAKAEADATDTQASTSPTPPRSSAPCRRASPPSAASWTYFVASAGITGPNMPVRDYPVEAWRQVIDVNLNGLFYCNQAALLHLERNGYGRTVNIASVAGRRATRTLLPTARPRPG